MQNLYNNFKLFIITLYFILIAPSFLFCQWELERVASEGRSGSIVVDSTGVIHIAYLKRPYGSDVGYAIRSNNQWTTETLTNNGEVNGIALALDKDQNPHIIYAEANPSDFNFFLKHITYRENGWSSAEKLVTTESDLMTWSPKIQIDKDNHIHITYLLTDADAGTGIIHYMTNSSGDWENQALNDKYQNPALYNVSMALDAEGYAHIVSYFSALGGPGYMTNAPKGQWSGTQLLQLNWFGGQLEALVIDIALDNNNNPHVSYVGSYDGSAAEHHMYATKTGPNNPWTFQKIDDGSWSSAGNAITSDPEGVEHIAYYHIESEELRYAMNYSGSWPHETVDTPDQTSNNYMRHVEIVADKDGFIHIAYEGDDQVLYATTRLEIPAPNIVLSPTSLTFGTVDTGQVSPKSIQIKNTGVLDLLLSDLALVGGDTTEFSLEHLCNNIVPDDSCAVQVTFEPVILGEKQTTLRIISDDPDTPVSSVSITGRTPYPSIATDPEELEFSSIEVGDTEILYLTLENIGDANLLIDSLQITGQDSGAFSYQSSCRSIAQTTSCNMEVEFNPLFVGTHSAILHVYCNDPYHPVVTISLKGKTPSAHIDIQTEILDFGTVPVGNLATEELIIRNTGERQLNISSFNISGTDAPFFRVANTCGVISADGLCRLALTFLPQTSGQKSARLHISSNDPNQPIYNVTLRGTGGEIQSSAFIYGTEDEERFFCIDSMSSGDYVVGGQTGKCAYLCQLTQEGEIVWEKQYTTDESGGFIYTIQELWDGGFIIGGSCGWNNRWIARLDSQGEIIWQKKPETDWGGRIYDVEVTSDSQFVAVGETWPLRTSDSDMWIGKFDSTGTLLWQKTIGKAGTEHFEIGMDVLELAGGDYIVAGGNASPIIPHSALINHPDGGYVYGGNRTKLWKISSIGTVLWQKELDLFYPYDFALVYFSPGDAILWQYKYPLSDDSIIFDLTITPTGDILALGSRYESGKKDMRIMRLTKTGDIVWQKIFSAAGNQEGYEVKMSTGRSLAIAGYYDTESRQEEGWFCQLDLDGNLNGCASSEIITTYSLKETGGSNITNISLPYLASDVVFINSDVSVSAGSLTAQNLCTGVPLDIDYDGIDDEEESGPDGTNPDYDGNEDGLPDSQQENVVSLHNFDGSGYLTISTENKYDLHNVSAIENPSPENQPEEFDFPLGFFNFTITGIDSGGSASTKFILPPLSDPITWYKYGLTPENAITHWYEFLYDDETGAIIDGNNLTLHFIDGKRGDDDITINKRITDIGAPGIEFILQPPDLVFPEDRTTNIILSPVLKWNPASRASCYHLLIALDDNFSNIIFNIDSINTDSLLIENLSDSTKHYWKMRSICDFDTSEWSETWQFTTITKTSIFDQENIPDKYQLLQNYPNPFNTTTYIRYGIPKYSRVVVNIYDIQGKLIDRIINQQQKAGWYRIHWAGLNRNGKQLSSGIYFLQIQAEDYAARKKMLLLR